MVLTVGLRFKDGKRHGRGKAKFVAADWQTRDGSWKNDQPDRATNFGFTFGKKSLAQLAKDYGYVLTTRSKEQKYGKKRDAATAQATYAVEEDEAVLKTYNAMHKLLHPAAAAAEVLPNSQVLQMICYCCQTSRKTQTRGPSAQCQS